MTDSDTETPTALVSPPRSRTSPNEKTTQKQASAKAVTKSKATKTTKSKVTKPAAPKPALAKTTTAKTTAATAKVVEAPAATSKMFTGTLTKSQRQAIRLKRRHEKGIQKGASSAKRIKTEDSSKLTSFLSDNPDETFGFINRTSELYQGTLKKPPPILTHVFIGMQSAGKSTCIERSLSAVLNVVQQGTGTRCPLDVTCIHDETCTEPRADLTGVELSEERSGMTKEDVFARIVAHNKMLATETRFSTESLYLVYRSADVLNMRFVDTPGIISNKSAAGVDCREEIKHILQAEMAKPNTKLAVLLEATEYDKNPIVDFLDESLGGRKGWIGNATFIMTKFDKQMDDTRTGNKANSFFADFMKEGIFPHLVVTPTLPREDLEPAKLFKKRTELLATSNSYERNRFDQWLNQHERCRDGDDSAELLDPRIKNKIGFQAAQNTIQRNILEHTIATLPSTLESIQNEKAVRQGEIDSLNEKLKLSDPVERKKVWTEFLFQIDERVGAYQNGDLRSSMDYPDTLQTLEEELFEEDNSPWAEKELNSHSEKKLRTRFAQIEGYPKEIQPDVPFHGGKQVQRAIALTLYSMIDSLPDDASHFKGLVANAAGYGDGGFMRENWERAMMQVCKGILQDVTRPGVNFLVKHIGFIFRSLFKHALEDVKEGYEFSHKFRQLPAAVQDHLVSRFDVMLWQLLKDAAKDMHTALGPMYSAINPNQDMVTDSAWNFRKELLSASGADAKQLLKTKFKQRSESTRAFLQDKRTPMMTEAETLVIIDRAFPYLINELDKFLDVVPRQVNTYLLDDFKIRMKKFVLHEAMDTTWEHLVEPAEVTKDRITELEGEVKELDKNLQEVQRMMQRI